MVAVDTDTLAVEETDDVVTLRLNRPDSLNALGPELVAGLRDAMAQLEADDRGVLFTGAGRATCAGMDTDIVSDDYDAEFGDLDATLYDFFDRVEAHPAPTGIAGFGALVGAAFGLSLCCDFVVLEAGTTFSVPEIRYGIVSEQSATLLPEVVGRRVATELLLTGAAIDPERAHDLGLVNAVVDEGEAEARTRAYLETVADYDAADVAAVKDLVR
ncbi:MAG: enoyl-CoA hydratase/isomerase family protein [Haloarculaceae archaeon]